jgi:uncharacterized protein (TIGR03067 family)
MVLRYLCPYLYRLPLRLRSGFTPTVKDGVQVSQGPANFSLMSSHSPDSQKFMLSSNPNHYAGERAEGEMTSHRIVKRSMRPCLFLVGLFVILPLFAANTQTYGASKDIESIQGTWRLVAGEIGGRKMTAQELKRAKLVFKGDRYTVRRGTGPTVTGTVRLDPAKNPRTIDITDANGQYRGKTLLGIYILDGDKFTECFASPGNARPIKFETKAGTTQFLHVWKHVKG